MARVHVVMTDVTSSMQVSCVLQTAGCMGKPGLLHLHHCVIKVQGTDFGTTFVSLNHCPIHVQVMVSANCLLAKNANSGQNVEKNRTCKMRSDFFGKIIVSLSMFG